MTPIEEIPTGITVDGRPLEDFIKEMEDTDKNKQVRKHYKGEIIGQLQSKKTALYYGKYREVKEPNGKVRRLTARQIREEYKMENKTQAESVIDLLRNRSTLDPGLSLKEITLFTQVPIKSLSPILTYMGKFGYIVREREVKKRGFCYKMVPMYKTWETQVLFEDYKQKTNEHRREQRKGRKTTKVDPLIARQEASKSWNRTQFPSVSKLIEEALGKVLKVKVEVSGSIEIKFVIGSNKEG